MSRFPKVIGAGVCAVLFSSTFVQAQTAASETLSEGTIKIAIVSASAIGGTAAFMNSRAHSQVASARENTHSTTIYRGNSAALLNVAEAGQPTLAERALRGTAVGDAIQIEYVAGTEAALAQAVSDLKRSSEIWGIRASELEGQRLILADRAAEARRLFVETPIDESSRGTRYQALTELQAVEKELSYVTRLQKDADKRMHRARAQYAAAAKNLEVTTRSHRVNQQFHIIQDVYVDGRANQLDSVFKNAIGEATTQAEARRMVPHVRLTRVQMPNAALAANAARGLKASGWALGISAALILEEVTVGAISEGLAEKAKTHYSPETRTEPQGASGRRY